MAAGAALLVLCATGWLGATGTMTVLAITGFAVGIVPRPRADDQGATPKAVPRAVYGLAVYSRAGFIGPPALVFGRAADGVVQRATLLGAALTTGRKCGRGAGGGRRTVRASPSARWLQFWHHRGVRVSPLLPVATENPLRFPRLTFCTRPVSLTVRRLQ